MTSYTFRNSLFDTPTTHLIQGDELILRRGDGFEDFIRLDEVRSVRFRTRRTRTGRAWQECIVRTAHRKVRLRSLHRVGFCRFESRMPAFLQFINAVLRALRPFAANVRFVTSSQSNHPALNSQESPEPHRGPAC